MTFGCTCPITGEFVKPKDIARDAYSVGYKNIVKLVDPLGFVIFHHDYPFERFNRFEVHPFSKRGVSAIRSAVNKCMKQMNGEINEEWILAEVMQKHLIKKVA